MGAESIAAMTDLQKKVMACAISDATSCATPCTADAAGACHLPETELMKLMFGELKEGRGFAFLFVSTPQTDCAYIIIDRELITCSHAFLPLLRLIVHTYSTGALSLACSSHLSV
jgi:hypothetical protein